MEGGGYLLKGTISRTVNGDVRVHEFLRADRFNSAEEAVGVTLRKGRQIIDERGDKVFDS